MLIFVDLAQFLIRNDLHTITPTLKESMAYSWYAMGFY